MFSQENNVVYCHEVRGLLEKMSLTEYFPHDWCLFIDSSKRSLKCVLLHNGKKLGSIPIAHSTKMKEDYNTISLVLEKIKHHEHHWVICVDLKMVNFLLGQQSGYTKFPCFLCLWDSRDRSNHWIKRYWPNRESMDVGKNNIINEPLVDREKIIFPPLHIKLGLMKQFVKALDKNGSCFLYLVENMPQLSIEKIKAGIFDGPQIRQLINDTAFLQLMNEVELKAWTSFVAVIENFLGNHKSENYMELVNEMLNSYEPLGCNMSIKVHYLHSHLECFPENLGNFSEEQGERFHQHIKTLENRYQGRCDMHMMADYCWSLEKDCPKMYSMMAKRKKFLNAH